MNHQEQIVLLSEQNLSEAEKKKRQGLAQKNPYVASKLSKISENEIYDAMLLINDSKIKITVAKIASALKCSTRTIYRNMSNELKKEKELLNQQL